MSDRLAVLLEGLGSEDPSVRDGWAYEELATGIRDGRFSADHDVIRTTAVARLDADEVQARTFAPLVLAWLVGAGDRDRAAFEAVARWYPAERDTRGYDDRLGWLHGVAHGADYLGACAATGIASGAEVLEVLARRTVAPGSAWRDQEDARVAAAAARALTRCDEAGATAWLEVLDGALGAFEVAAAAGEVAGRPPAWLHNVSALCSTLYVALAEQPRDGAEDLDVPHADLVRARLAEVLARMTPWLIAVRSRPGPAPA